jgi:hypothetical protein
MPYHIFHVAREVREELIEALIGVSPTKYSAVGLFLGIPYQRMQVCEMEDSHADKIALMVDLLLDGKYDKSFGEPSWKKAVCAVAVDDGGGDQSLAKRIAANHPKGWSLMFCLGCSGH